MTAVSPGPILDDTAGRRTDTAGAVLANGRLLVTLSARGEVEQLVWPHLDHEPQLGLLRLGVTDDDGGVRWLDADAVGWRQSAPPDARVVTTEVDLGEGPHVRVVDVVDPTDDVLVREVHTGGRGLVVAATPTIGGHTRGGGALVDPATGAVVSYRRDHVMALRTDVAAEASVGEPRRATSAVDGLVTDGVPGGDTLAHGIHDVVLLTAPTATVRVAVAMGPRTPDAVTLAGRALERDTVARRRVHDAGLLDGAVVPDVPEVVDAEAATSLFQSSLLAVDSMTDRSGAVLAGPEVDPDFLRSGGYGFVWARDLAMIVRAMLAAGQRPAAGAALRWLAATQGGDGLWAQRQWTDGSPAPCWGVQLDETGAVLHAMGVGCRALADRDLEDTLWPALQRGADALVRFRDPDTGLPLASVDLWEERTGTHAFTAAACAAGLREAAAIADRRGDRQAAARWTDVSRAMVAGIGTHFWDDELGRYVRSRWVGDDDAANDAAAAAGLRAPEGHAIGRFAAVRDTDEVVDVCLLGLADPFGVVPADDPRMVATADAVERELRTRDGGLLRYADDTYVGGNPWVLTTLWLGTYRRAAGDGGAELARALDWALARRTPTGLLPEQVDEDTGAPRWVVPLTWSHAMVLLGLGTR